MPVDVTASIAAWLALAEADVRIAQLVMEAPDASAEMYGLACFHAQQAAEKGLKALLTKRGVAFPRTHDNAYLLAALAESTSPELQDASALLAEYGVGPRYPGVAAGRSQAEAQEALAACSAVFAWLRSRLPAAEE